MLNTFQEVISDKVSKEHLTLGDLGISPKSVKDKMAYFIRPRARINYYRALLGEEAPTALDSEPVPWSRVIGVGLMLMILVRIINANKSRHPLEGRDHYGQPNVE